MACASVLVAALAGPASAEDAFLEIEDRFLEIRLGDPPLQAAPPDPEARKREERLERAERSARRARAEQQLACCGTQEDLRAYQQREERHRETRELLRRIRRAPAGPSPEERVREHIDRAQDGRERARRIHKLERQLERREAAHSRTHPH
jgi:hypothetical protein